MKFTANDLYRAAMIGDRAKLEYIENGVLQESVVEMMGIDSTHLLFRKGMYSGRQEIALKDIQSIERIGSSPENMAERVAMFLKQKQNTMRDKKNGLNLWKRFGNDLETLKRLVEQFTGCSELLAFFSNNSALSGDIKRQPMAEIERQIESVRPSLGEELSSFAECMIALAKRDIVKAMKAYLNVMGDTIDASFVRKYAAKLAIVSVQLSGNLKNDCAFIYWIDQLLDVDPAQVINDEAIWLNYLSKCVTFQHFKPLCEVLRIIEKKEVVFDALAFVMALNEQPIQACQALDCIENAYGANYSAGQLLFQLVDDEHSYCVRYADRVRCLIAEKKIGKENVGYIYDYVRIRRFAHIVNGCLVSYFVNAADIDSRLLDYMNDCLIHGLDYEPDMVFFTPQVGGVATNVER